MSMTKMLCNAPTSIFNYKMFPRVIPGHPLKGKGQKRDRGEEEKRGRKLRHGCRGKKEVDAPAWYLRRQWIQTWRWISKPPLPSLFTLSKTA